MLASYDNLKEIYFRYTVKKTGTKDHVEGGLPVKEAPVETVTIEISTDGKNTPTLFPLLPKPEDGLV